MCGILGVVRMDRPEEQQPFRQALDRLRHRGPDGEGEWVRGGDTRPFVRFGHRRLSILDLSDAGRQPMVDATGRFTLLFNGEIYNYRELREELAGLGHEFRSRSDTEVLLQSYAQWGGDCLARLDGMFAFAVWDEERGELFAARDRFGEKPFHYRVSPGGESFEFASEMKALVRPRDPVARDDRALYRFVAFSELAGAEDTLVAGIRRLRNAHWLRVAVDGGRLHVTTGRYWDVNLEDALEQEPTDAAQRVRELLRDSIRLRLRSDVPVGSSLSGGIDSSAVVCQIHELGAASGQRTFSARMEESALDEGDHIRTVTEHTGLPNHEVWPSASDLDARFDSLCAHQEEPFASTSQFAQYLVMHLASQRETIVLLDGQGADEVFAGYRPYFLTYFGSLLKSGQRALFLREWMAYRRVHGEAFPMNLRTIVARSSPRLRRWKRRALGQAESRASTALDRWWDRDWAGRWNGEERRPRTTGVRDELTCLLYDDLMHGPMQDLLRYGDRNSTAWSRELRQPFLDHRLVEYVFRLPSTSRIRDGESKSVLRRALDGLVPPSILARQDKLGYQAPLASWCDDALESWFEERLARAAGRLPLAKDVVDRWRGRPRPTTEAAAREVFSILTLDESLRSLGVS